MRTQNYDLAIIGGGAAGLVAGVAAGAFGSRAAMVELEDRLGGECSWTGCVPSKALLHEASLAGCRGGHPQTGVMERVREITRKTSRASKAKDLLEKYGVKVIHGRPSFRDRHTLEMDDGTRIKSAKFIICTGSSARIPDLEGLENDFLTNRNVWDLPSVPESLLVIGGGPIGTELARAFYLLGTKVTLFQARDRLLPRDDGELARELTGMFIDDGMDIRLNARVKKVQKTDRGWVADSGEEQQSARHLLIAAGRRSNTEGLNLEAAGVEYSEDKIKVNQYMQTTAGNIWAAGDCTGGLQFSHLAEIEAKAAVRNALFPFNSRVDYQGSPWATFTDPELAHLGMTEEECREKNYNYRVYSQPFAGDDRAITDRADRGRVKIIASPYGRLLGVHILGPRAGELINEFILARRKGMRLHEIGLTVHVYPTLGMAVQRATDDWFAEMANKPLARLLIRLARR